jgi:hypothetical protein
VFGSDDSVMGEASDEEATGAATEDDDAIGAASEDEATGTATDEDDGATTTAEEDDDATGATELDDTDGVVFTTAVVLPRLKIQIRPMITITATIMIIQVLRFMEKAFGWGGD